MGKDLMGNYKNTLGIKSRERLDKYRGIKNNNMVTQVHN